MEASCDPGPVGVALMSGNVLQPAANGFLFDLYLDPAQNFRGKAFALTSDGSGDYFIALSQTIISAGTAFISAGQSSSGRNEFVKPVLQASQFPWPEYVAMTSGGCRPRSAANPCHSITMCGTAPSCPQEPGYLWANRGL